MDKVVFSDSKLNRYLSRAVADYFRDAGYARGEFPLDIDENGECPLPEDYVGIVVAYDDEGRKILASSISRAEENLPEYATERGEHVECIFREISDDGKIRVSPIPEQERIPHHEDDQYGIVTQMYGCAFGFIPNGATTSWEQLEGKGSIVYLRHGDLEEVADGIALVYHMLAQCYVADTDFMNSKLGSAYAELYKSRVGTRMVTSRGSAYSPRNGNFF